MPGGGGGPWLAKDLGEAPPQILSHWSRLLYVVWKSDPPEAQHQAWMMPCPGQDGRPLTGSLISIRGSLKTAKNPQAPCKQASSTTKPMSQSAFSAFDLHARFPRATAPPPASPSCAVWCGLPGHTPIRESQDPETQLLRPRLSFYLSLGLPFWTPEGRSCSLHLLPPPLESQAPRGAAGPRSYCACRHPRWMGDAESQSVCVCV